MIALIDCNNFFASCERLFRPDLNDKPVLVLSSNDGCVVARSQEVRQLGVPMGVPYFKIKNIVKKYNITCFSSNFGLYSNISQRMLSLLDQQSPEVEVYSIDEAFLNLRQLNIKDYSDWGHQLRSNITKNVGIPVSVGIAPTKTLAKIAARYAKKIQQTCILSEQETASFETILRNTSINDVWGIGRQLALKFEASGIKNAWQLYNASQNWLHSQLGINGLRMYNELHNTVAYPIQTQKQPQKSLIASRSFGHTIKNIHELETAVASFASKAAFNLRANNQITAVFGIFLRYRYEGAMKGQSIAVPLLVPSNDTSELVETALELLRQIYEPEHGYKKAGVFAHHLSNANVCQTSLLKPRTQQQITKRQLLMEALDDINKKYGSNAIHIASIDTSLTKWHAIKRRMSPSYTTNWLQLPLVYRSSS